MIYTGNRKSWCLTISKWILKTVLTFYLPEKLKRGGSQFGDFFSYTTSNRYFLYRKLFVFRLKLYDQVHFQHRQTSNKLLDDVG